VDLSAYISTVVVPGLRHIEEDGSREIGKIMGTFKN